MFVIHSCIVFDADFVSCYSSTNKRTKSEFVIDTVVLLLIFLHFPFDIFPRFIAMRASGKLMTNAQYLRNFVRSHPSYKKDSRVPPEAAYDLVRKATRIGQGLEPCPEVLGDFHVDPCFPAANPFRDFAGVPGTPGNSPKSGAADHGGLPLPSTSTNRYSGVGAVGERENSQFPREPGATIPLETRPINGEPLDEQDDDQAAGRRVGFTERSTTNGTNGKETTDEARSYADCHPAWNNDLDDVAPEKRVCLTAASNSKDPCNMPESTDGRKKELLASYLARAKERRNVALIHSLKVMRSEIERLQAQTTALESDLAASYSSGTNRLHLDMSAERMVQANNLFANRSSYRQKHDEKNELAEFVAEQQSSGNSSVGGSAVLGAGV